MPPVETVRTEGTGPRVLVESRPDSASVNIAEHLRRFATWQETDLRFLDAPVLRLEAEGPPVYLVSIPEWHIHHEGLGEDLAEALGFPLEALIVLSRHRAASGVPSFTAHPVGNPGPEAVAGGRPRTPTPTHPHLLSHAYRMLKQEAAKSHLPHNVTLEATHHGPVTAVPLLFMEIGSDETHWPDPEAGAVVARAALEVATYVAPVGTPVVMGIGGGHYVPRFVGLLDDTMASVGHLIASYHWKDGAGVPREVLAGFLEASRAPGADRPDGVYFDRKSLPGADRRVVLDDLEALEVPLVRTQDVLALQEER